MLSFPVKIFTKDIIMVMVLTVQGNMFTNICTNFLGRLAPPTVGGFRGTEKNFISLSMVQTQVLVFLLSLCFFRI